MIKLKEYLSKRDLKHTPEPKAEIKKSKSKQLLFVIHKHRASHLHYDLRLEVGGVLKSWAIPKGPSLNPSDKRLAIMVEDHPYEYHTFEGIIPKGNYGAGEVIIWDQGTYAPLHAMSVAESEKLMEEGLKKGHVDIIFNGEKLKGEFALIRTGSFGGKNSWLLMKKKDQYASKSDVTKLDRSVESNRTIEEIAGKTSLPQEGKKAKMPHHIKPMLGYLEKKPLDAKGWIFEIKWDGYRAIAELDKHRIELYSRNQLSFNDKFRDIIDELKHFPVQSAILDGEVVVIDKHGRPNFQLMQNFQRTREGQIYYYVFDILYLNGRDLKELPLIERKAILKQLIASANSSLVQYSDHIEEKGIAFFKLAEKKSLEGIMAKNGQSSYKTNARSHDWLKIKTHLRQEVVIGGITLPRGSRKKFGALLIGVYDKQGELRYVGRVGGGFTEKLLGDVYSQLEPLIQKSSPFIDAPKMTGVTWVKPKLVCEVNFAEWTEEGLMRQPIFVGMRIDKNSKDVKRE